MYERNSNNPETYRARKTITFLSEYTDDRYREYSAIIEAGLAQCTPQCNVQPPLNTSDADIYIRDATGNVLAVYHYDRKTAQLRWSEQHLYGSSRLGMFQPEKIVTSVSTDSKQREVGYWGKQIFELSNHLGNILATITDKKLQVSTNNSSTSYFEAEVQSVQDYYAFGMQMPGRKSSGEYRYGFNGKENDNEVKGEGNQQDYGMRIYDGRIGKFLSVDPVTSDYPELTPYQFASNRPIDGIDFDGLEYMKAGTSIYGLHLFKHDEVYVKEDLWIKNVQIHAKVENHEKAFKITNQDKLVDPDSPKELAPYVNFKGKTPSQKRKELFRANKELKQNMRESSGDIAGGTIDFLKFGINLYWNNKDVNEINAAAESISALSKSDQLVKNASLNPTFPLKLNNDQVKTDLVNFIVDATMPDASSAYRNIISTWGRLIYKNENAINNQKFNFSPNRTDFKEKSWFMSWGKTKTIYFFENKGNPSKEVKNANDLLKSSTPHKANNYKSRK